MANDALNNLPDVSFIDNITIDSVLEEMITDFQDKYYELTGDYEILGELDRNRILINAAALKIYQGYQHIEKTGKMNLLKYASGDYLINLGANRGIEINEPKPAKCDMKFSLNQLQSSTIVIPKGTLITAGDGVYFETVEYAEILSGSQEVIVGAICQITGTVGNGYVIGQLNVLVEPIPYIELATNITESSGGEDVQTDDEFRKRIFLAPSGYSTAGPEDAYIFWTMQYSTLITDVKVITTEDDTVQIIVLKKDGEIPEENFLTGVKEFLEDGNIKPLTEKVEVIAPTIVNYDIVGTYYINSSDKIQASTIQNAVNTTLDEYINWQKEKIGRDLNPFHLQYLLVKAGVKRIELTSPNFLNIESDSIAIEEIVQLNYGGIEDD